MASRTSDNDDLGKSGERNVADKSIYRGQQSWTYLRLFVSILFVLSAVLKTHALSTAPVVPRDVLESKFIQLLAAEGELCLAAWLMSGFSVRTAYVTTLSAFVILAVISAVRLAMGFHTCGCFGRLSVHPAITLGLDVTVAAVLTVVRPTSEEHCTVKIAYAIAIAYSIAAIVILVLVLFYSPRTIGEDGILSKGTGVIVLDPDSWVGKRFPLLMHLDGNASQLMRGDWTVVFYHHDCSQCLAIMPKYLTRMASDKTNDTAFVEVPPFGHLPMIPSRYVRLRLSDKHKWFIVTPTELQLRKGVVVLSSPQTSEGRADIVR